jgi:hypothetical protein
MNNGKLMTDSSILAPLTDSSSFSSNGLPVPRLSLRRLTISDLLNADIWMD